jgi:hypothetical protein
MVKLRARFIRIGFLVALLTILASGTSLAPQQAVARPIFTGGPDGTPYGTGDPTGDDLPSPTPKPLVRTVRSGMPISAAQTRRQAIFDRWQVFFGTVIRFGLR